MDFLGPVLRIVEIIVGIGILIMIHEMGHFAAAKWSGVRVDKFALGMGPKIFAVVRGETEYSVRWIPLGGFVLMAGEEPGVATEAASERQFRKQKPWKRVIILFAGSFMNFVLAIVFFAIAFGFGVNFTLAKVGWVEPGGPADKAGVRPGDEIVAANGDRDVDWEDVRIMIAMASRGDNVSLRVKRGSETLDLSVRPQAPAKGELPMVGMEVAAGRRIEEIRKGSAAEAAGLKVGDVVDTVDGREFLYWPDFLLYCSTRIGKPVAFVVTRDGERKTLDVTPRPAKRGVIGLVPATFPTVAKVIPGGAAAAAGVRPGDQVLAIDNVPTPCRSDIVSRCGTNAGKGLDFRILREGREIHLVMTPRQLGLTGPAMVGMAFSPGGDFTIGEVRPGSPAAKAGFNAGDVLTRIGKDMPDNATWGTLQAALDTVVEKGDNAVVLSRRSGAEGPEFKAVKVAVESVDDPLDADVGISVTNGQQHLRKFGPWKAPFVGFKKSWQVVKQIYLSLKGVFTGDISAKHFAGPVGIARMSYSVASDSITKFIFWLAFLSANFAVFNMLPLTPFDGGLIVVTGVEKLRGKPLSDRALMVLMTAGWALVIVFFVFVTANDIMRKSY